MSKNTYLSLILTEVDYRKQIEHTSGGLSDTFQTMGRQSDFRPNHRWVMCNYLFFFKTNFPYFLLISKKKKKAKMALFQHP